MLPSINFMFDTYWTLWVSLFPDVPLWSPHGAVMTLIIAPALAILAGVYGWTILQRT